MTLTPVPTPHVHSYRAEANAFDLHRQRPLKDWHLASDTEPTAFRALARLRLRVRKVARHLEIGAQAEAWRWLHSRAEVTTALEALAGGEMYLHLLEDDAVQYEFILRPVYLCAPSLDWEPSGDVVAQWNRWSA